MNAERDDRPGEPLIPEAEVTRRLLADLPPPRAPAAFQARLREDFPAGRLEATVSGLSPAHRGSSWRWAWLALPAAAALAFAMARFGTEETRWILWHVRGDSGQVVWNGQAYTVADSNALRSAIERGGQASFPGDLELDMFQKGFASIQFAPGTSCSISAPPKRLGKRLLEMRLDGGEVRISTGVRFAGARLAVRTDETMVEVVGTTLAVIKDPAGTCVCAFAGEIAMRDEDGTSTVVPVGMRRFLYSDGRPPQISKLAPGEAMKLGMFLELQRDNLHE